MNKKDHHAHKMIPRCERRFDKNKKIQILWNFGIQTQKFNQYLKKPKLASHVYNIYCKNARFHHSKPEPPLHKISNRKSTNKKTKP